MIQNIKQREEKIQEIRKNTPWRDFIKELASRFPIVLHKNNGVVSRYPITNRIKGITKDDVYNQNKVDIANKDFFESIIMLQQKIDMPNLISYGGNENSEFADIKYHTKNTYLSFNSVRDNQDILYSSCIKSKCNDVLNSVMVRDGSQNIYTCSGIIKSSNIFYSKFIINCNNIRFSTNLIGCSECIGCYNLKNQSFCIKNKTYSKQEYFKIKKNILNKTEKFDGYYKLLLNSNVRKINFNIDSNEIKNGYGVYQINKGRNLFIAGSENGNQNMYDVFIGGSSNSNDFYGAVSSGSSQYVYIGESIGLSSNIYYSINVQNCSYCLGCIGLKNKSFCILNKQYTKEEWFEKANEIFSQMENDGQLGKFFPASMNPFYFNDTVAYLIDDSFTKEEVTKEGFLRRDEAIKVDIPEGMDIVKISELNNYQGWKINDKFYSLSQIGDKKIKDGVDMKRKIDPEILKKVIVDEKGNYYRIVKTEYDFLMKYGLPLPELHWLDRIKLGFKF